MSKVLYRGEWTGELDWTVATRFATLEGLKYKLVNASTVVFSVPVNLNNEDRYRSIKVSSLPADTNAVGKNCPCGNEIRRKGRCDKYLIRSAVFMHHLTIGVLDF